MGFIIDTNDKELGLERRRESFYIYENNEESKHIFTYNTNGLVEISKEFLKKIVDYFNQHQEELKSEIEEDLK